MREVAVEIVPGYTEFGISERNIVVCPAPKVNKYQKADFMRSGLSIPNQL
jgi:hypothetical protein